MRREGGLPTGDRQVLSFIERETARRGVPPSVREIGRRFGWRSSRTAHDHVRGLVEAGFLRRLEGHRGLRLTRRAEVLLDIDRTGNRVRSGIGRPGRGRPVPAPRTGREEWMVVPDLESGEAAPGIPILGRIAAGAPLLAVEQIEGYLPFGAYFGPADGLFCLRVQGDSMIDAGIWDGDHVVVRQQSRVDDGTIAAVLVDEEATVKRLYRERGGLRLQPENETMDPIRVGPDAEVHVLGKVVGVVRQVR